MRRFVLSGLSTAVSRIALVSLIGSAAAACSTDSARFAESPFTNPFASSDRVATEPDTTASTRPAPIYGTAPVQTQALPPVQSSPVRTAAASAPVLQAPPGPGGYSAQGGTSVTVGSNDTLNTISQRYGVPASAILTASGMTSPAQVRPGATVTIPVYNAGSAPTRVASAASGPGAGSEPAPAPQPKFRLVESPRPVAAAAPKVAAAEPVAAPGRAEEGSPGNGRGSLSQPRRSSRRRSLRSRSRPHPPSPWSARQNPSTRRRRRSSRSP